MAEAATNLPVKTEKTSTPATAGEWAPFESLRREIDRLFDTFPPFGWSLPPAQSVLGFEVPRLSRAAWPVAPAIDLTEKEKEYEITAELPGLDETNVEIKLSNNTDNQGSEEGTEGGKGEGLFRIRAPLRVLPARLPTSGGRRCREDRGELRQGRTDGEVAEDGGSAKGREEDFGQGRVKNCGLLPIGATEVRRRWGTSRHGREIFR